MMNKRKKGSAILYTIVVVSILLLISISALSLSFSNRISTLNFEGLNNLKTIAQTGVDIGLAVLKEKIVLNVLNSRDIKSSVLYNTALDTNSTVRELGLEAVNTLPGDMGSFSIAFNVFGQEVDSTNPKNGDCFIRYVDKIDNNCQPIEDLDNYITPTGKISKRCIKMTVLAFGRKQTTKKIEVYIDKDSISNYYMEKILGNVLTVINETNNPEAVFDNSEITQFNASGDIYFKGNKINSINGIDGKKRSITVDDEKKVIFSNTKKSLPSMNLSDLKNVDIIDIPTEDQLIEENKFSYIESDYSDKNAPFLVTSQCKPNLGEDAVDLNKIILGKDLDSTKGLRYYIANTPVFNFENEADLTKMFKLVVVYGDLNIDCQSFYTDGINYKDSDEFKNPASYRQITPFNYIIICLGKVKIKGRFNFINSSIFAREIKFEKNKNNDLIVMQDEDGNEVLHTVSTDTAVNMKGIGVEDSIKDIKESLSEYYDDLPDNAWGYFNNTERALLNSFLIKNLPDAYSKALKLKVIDWKESGY
ncbi:hypothetical protein Q428_01375 [Fervidicella metallireducens AeB]|uniref:Uncharacterized protein n=1 Tax=Fervidicella metallireducens AeB TaxID=1403537 RepID=A0A017RYI2_9CLOT|nr:hypothetical protein [Fervidicella metallireducens]EYE89732.1 hypothetical protein Q428_01375 [Fervidicella metallireducens AeB]